MYDNRLYNSAQFRHGMKYKGRKKCYRDIKMINMQASMYRRQIYAEHT